MHSCIKSLTIHLLNSKSTFSAGEVIDGWVEVLTIDRLKINGLKIGLVGEGKVEWTEKFGKGRFESLRKFSDSEKYIDVSAQLLSRPKGGHLYFEVGEHRYKFMIQLPMHLPTSFEHSLARIRYYLVATIDIPWNLNKVFKMPITVIDLVDLNLNKSLRISCSSSNSRTLCCFCCRSKPIVCSLSCQKSGYVAGEAINFCVSIDNQSTRFIQYATVSLIQNIRLSSKAKSRLLTREVTQMKLDRRVEPFSRDEWHSDHSMIIPSICPSTASYCRIVDISYSLELILHPSWSASIRVKVPLCIGTVPIHHHFAATATATATSGESPANSLSDIYTPPAVFPASNKTDLPSYLECVFNDSSLRGLYSHEGSTNHLDFSVNNESMNDHPFFSPLYPNYKHE